MVLVDFWTYSCINCIRTLPYLNAWNERYAAKGLTIVGVHTPEFPFEHSAANVQEAIHQNGIRYPVVQDNNYKTWNAYNNEYWPAEYLIDAKGRIRLTDFGEGEYAAKERAIRSLLVEAGAERLGQATKVAAQAPSAVETTPESYLGAEKAERFENGALQPGPHDFGSGAAPRARTPALRGQLATPGGIRRSRRRQQVAAQLLRSPRVPRRGLGAWRAPGANPARRPSDPRGRLRERRSRREREHRLPAALPARGTATSGAPCAERAGFTRGLRVLVHLRLSATLP